MIIRAARSTEVKTLAALGVLAWEQALESSGESTHGFIKGAEATYFHFCSHNWPIIIAAEVNGEVLGWGALDPTNNKLTDIWVLPDFQRNGLGAALLNALETQVQARDFSTIELETHARNGPAIEFFKKNGFAVSSLKSTYSPGLDKNIDTVEMRKSFILLTSSPRLQ